ncbi:MAG: YdcF family protein [Verrucomicrobiaceae bacterium]
MKTLTRFLLRSLMLIGGLSIVAVLLFTFRVPLFRAAGKCWVVDEHADKADAVVVLGGGTDWRPQAAAKILRDGRARYLLVPKLKATQVDQLGLRITENDVTLALLEKLGVPSSSVVVYGDGVANTHDEALGVRDWAKAHDIHSIIIPTDFFPSRRTRWIFQRVMSDSGVTVHVETIAPPAYNLDNWWQNEEGMIAFPVEVMKMFFYWIHY